MGHDSYCEHGVKETADSFCERCEIDELRGRIVTLEADVEHLQEQLDAHVGDTK